MTRGAQMAPSMVVKMASQMAALSAVSKADKWAVKTVGSMVEL